MEKSKSLIGKQLMLKAAKISFKQGQTNDPTGIQSISANITQQQIIFLKQNCHNILSIQINQNSDSFEYSLLRHIFQIPSLTRLIINCPVNLKLITKNITKLKNIKSLSIPDLQGNHINTIGQILPMLQEIQLSKSHQKLKLPFLKTCLSLPNLKSLKFKCFRNIKKYIMEYILKCFSHLESLSFEKCKFENNDAFKIISKFIFLKRICLLSVEQSSGQLKNIFQSLTSLSQVELQVDSLSRQQLLILSQRCKKLQKIKLDNVKLDKQSIQIISTTMKSLVDIKITGLKCEQEIELKTLNLLVDSLQGLVKLDLRKCFSLQKSSIITISQKMCNLQDLILPIVNLQSSVIPYLRRMKLLKYLNLSVNVLFFDIFKLLVCLVRLEILIINSKYESPIYQNVRQISNAYIQKVFSY